MNARHTPGPYHVEPDESNEGHGLAICAKDAVIATITPPDDVALTGEDRANAALFAAAPALLAALVHARDFVDQYAKLSGRNFDVDLSIVDTAIQQARGEA